MIKYKIEYYLIVFFAKFLMLFPKRWRIKFFKGLGYLTFLLYKKNRRVIEQNLLYVYDKKISQKEIKEIQKSCYQKLFLNVLNIIEDEYISKEEIEKMIIVENKEFIDKLIKDKKPFIYVTAHIGNIDFLGCLVGKLFTPGMYQVYQKLNNPFLSEYMKSKRESCNLKMVEKHGAVKQLVLALKKNKVISLIIDQAVNPKYGQEVIFLGKKVEQTPTASMLAKKFNIPLLPIFIVSDDDKEKRYKIILKEPIYPEDRSIQELNQLQADILSEIILKYPKEWFWCHKRFKNSNPKIYQD